MTVDQIVKVVREKHFVIVYFGNDEKLFEPVLGNFVDNKQRQAIMNNYYREAGHELVLRFANGRYMDWNCRRSIDFYGLNFFAGTSRMYPDYYVLDVAHNRSANVV